MYFAGVYILALSLPLPPSPHHHRRGGGIFSRWGRFSKIDKGEEEKTEGFQEGGNGEFFQDLERIYILVFCPFRLSVELSKVAFFCF